MSDDDQPRAGLLDLRGLLHWKVCGLLPFENAAGINASQTICISQAGSVAHQTAGSSVLAKRGNRRHRMACRQCHDLIALAGEERIGGDDERTRSLFDEGCKGGGQLTFGAGAQDMEIIAGGAPLCAVSDLIGK